MLPSDDSGSLLASVGRSDRRVDPFDDGANLCDLLRSSSNDDLISNWVRIDRWTFYPFFIKLKNACHQEMTETGSCARNWMIEISVVRCCIWLIVRSMNSCSAA